MSIELTSPLAIVLAVVTVIVEIIVIYIAPKRGWNQLRRLFCLDACEEAVHICAEKGSPFLYDMGGLGGGIGSAVQHPGYQAWIPAVLTLIKHLATVCGQVGVRMQTIGNDPVGVLMARDYMREGYISAGRPEMYSADLVTYIPNWVSQTFYAIEYTKREKPGAGVVIGAHWWATNVSLIETLKYEDAFVVAGTIYAADNAPAVLAADVATLGEENVAMGAYLAQDPLSSSTLVGEDIIKVLLIVLLIVLPFLSLIYGSDELIALIKGWG
jgi:hypothetical protein